MMKVSQTLNARLFVNLIAAGLLGVPATLSAADVDVTVPGRRGPVLPAPAANVDRAPADEAARWADVPALRWGRLDVAALAAEDAQRGQGAGVPLRIGIDREVPAMAISAAVDGDWTIEPDGSRRWAMRLQATDAVAVRVHVARLEVPPGATLLMQGNGHNRVEVFPRNGRPNETSFWSPMLAGSEVFIEYRQPAGVPGEPVIEIDAISHIYRDPATGVVPELAAADGEDGGVAGLFPCHEDVACHSLNEVARDSVGRMIYTSGGTWVCTGGLLADVDDNTYAGYFLTANHCISTQAAASSLTVYWFYQRSVCGGAVPSLFSLPRSDGALLLANSSQTDFSFMRFFDDPRHGQGFAAWTTTAPSGTVRGIHHPGGSYKRFSEGFTTSSQPICGGLPTSRYVYNKWSLGITEGGSSGSPLFNTNWEVVGQLYGVCYFSPPNCTNPSQYNNVYGRLSVTYPSISSYLNAIIPDDSYEPNDSIAEAAPITPGVHNLRLVDFDDYFAITVSGPSEISATTTYSSQDMNLSLHLRNGSGDIVATGSGPIGFRTFTTSVSAGTWYLHTTRTTGWGGDYELDLGVVSSICAPPDEAAAEPGGEIKNRFISFVPGSPGVPTAIRVRMASLNRPDGLPGSPDFSGFEGQDRWVGPPQIYSDMTAPGGQFSAAPLQCEPHYMDWGAVGLVHVYGAGIVPSSSYDVEIIEEGCDQMNAVNYSPSLIVATTRWGDVTDPFQPPSPTVQPDLVDITAIVAVFGGNPSSIGRLRAMLQPHIPDPDALINVSDISAAVSAFGGASYPYAGPESCP